MTATWKCLMLAGVLSGTCVLSAQAQIRYVTVRTIKSPLPPMDVVPFTATPQTNSPPAPVLRVPTVAAPYTPSLDKAELTRRVVAFQKQRAEEGSASAQYELGVRYLKGDGVEKDMAAARKWLTAAAEAGESQAQRKLKELGK